MLKVTALDFDYQDQPLLKNVGFHVPEGGLLHLRGANGTGKTTLLKLIAGLYQPAEGQIQFLGQSIATNLGNYQKQICYVGHKSAVNPHLTLRENCLYDLHYACKHQQIEQLAAVFHLQAYLDIFCGQLSAGQRRQVALLRLWMTNAKLWLLDEPLVALDNTALHILMTQIIAHRKQGGVVVLTSHQTLPLLASDYQEYLL